MKNQQGANENSSHPELNRQLRSKFELVSAYLDGEVTAGERRQVQQWLESDRKVQKLYNRLVKLRHTMRTLPVPANLTPVEETIERVFIRLNRSHWRRLSLAGGTVAAMIVAGLGIFSPRYNIPELASSPVTETAETAPEALMVALNKPPIEIPKPASAIHESGVREQEGIRTRKF